MCLPARPREPASSRQRIAALRWLRSRREAARASIMAGNSGPPFPAIGEYPRFWDGIPQSSVDTPTFVGWGAGQVEAQMFDPKVLAGLEKMGLRVEVISSEQAGISRGYWAGVQIDPVTRRMKGGVS